MCMFSGGGVSANGGEMGQIEELKVFVSERLHAAASDILGAIEKTITDYEEQASRLKEENDRHRSLLDIILKAKTPRTEARQATKSTHAAARSCASDSSPRPEKPKSKTRASHFHSRGRAKSDNKFSQKDWQWAFTSRTDFIKFAAIGDCPYCLKRIQATETHLIKKHYLNAVHFNEDGTEKFVVPCTCEDLIQGRSHWHCPYCTKIINRRCNFEIHISKQHGSKILQQSQDTEVNQPSVSAFEEEVPPSPETWSQQFSSLNQEDHQASLLLQVKQEEDRGMCRQVSHAEWQNSVQVEIEGKQMRKGNSQMSLEVDHVQEPLYNIVYVDSCIQDVSEINSVQSSEEHHCPNSSNPPLETQPYSGAGGIQQPAEDSQHTTPGSSLKRKKHVKKSLSLSKKSAQPSVRQNPAGPYRCKACGETFHNMYTLRGHMVSHIVDETCICGICGKHLETTDSLFQHLQRHANKYKCGICGKQFSSSSRLIQHKRFHRPKRVNVTS